MPTGHMATSGGDCDAADVDAATQLPPGRLNVGGRSSRVRNAANGGGSSAQAPAENLPSASQAESLGRAGNPEAESEDDEATESYVVHYLLADMVWTPG
ncbi:hypothetical protein R1sor_022659 [Riccia sorocarpa]|uniref:Uncharacterized protein n=1 Tax=Riccia sorocarpa TaxID=122646 RepID=A0ABD3GL72_9MARC